MPVKENTLESKPKKNDTDDEETIFEGGSQEISSKKSDHEPSLRSKPKSNMQS